MDSIIIRDLALDAVIGTLEHERHTPQRVIFNLEIFTDLAPAGRSDDLRDAINYAEVEEAVKRHVEASQYFLLEKLAESVASIVLAFDGVKQVALSIDKPGAPRYARSIAVRIIRTREQ